MISKSIEDFQLNELEIKRKDEGDLEVSLRSSKSPVTREYVS